MPAMNASRAESRFRRRPFTVTCPSSNARGARVRRLARLRDCAGTAGGRTPSPTYVGLPPQKPGSSGRCTWQSGQGSREKTGYDREEQRGGNGGGSRGVRSPSARVYNRHARVGGGW
eukprot:93319-Pleurochrysis_carterae.AAC.1